MVIKNKLKQLFPLLALFSALLIVCIVAVMLFVNFEEIIIEEVVGDKLEVSNCTCLYTSDYSFANECTGLQLCSPIKSEYPYAGTITKSVLEIDYFQKQQCQCYGEIVNENGRDTCKGIEYQCLSYYED